MSIRYFHGAIVVAVAAGLTVLPPALRAQAANPAAHPATHAQRVEVIAEDYAFDAPDAVPAGWTTLRFRNDGDEHHMVFMSRLPEGKTVEDYEHELSAAFGRAWDAVREGRAEPQEAVAALFQELPAWFPEVEFVGGPGVAAPGVTSEVTLNLEPGNYVLECYVKTPEGEIHYMEGMIRPLTVSEQRFEVPPPASDIRVTLSNFDMAVEGNLTPGRHTVAVHVAENPEEGFGHSVHVARLEPGTEVQEVVEWMNWFALDGYREPAPARFVGGMHPLPAGSTAYFTVDLEPGRYLFVSEGTGAQGVRREVTVR